MNSTKAYICAARHQWTFWRCAFISGCFLCHCAINVVI